MRLTFLGSLLRSSPKASMQWSSRMRTSGHFQQEIVAGAQAEHAAQWQPEQWCRRLPVPVAMEIAAGRDVCGSAPGCTVVERGS